jgi:hypothetical protein
MIRVSNTNATATKRKQCSSVRNKCKAFGISKSKERARRPSQLLITRQYCLTIAELTIHQEQQILNRDC